MGDTYKDVKVMKFPDCTAFVYIPDLTPEERSRRMKEIEKAAASLLRSVKR